MTEEQRKIQQHREFLKSGFGVDDFESDQQKRLPQPPLVKPAGGGKRIELDKDFAGVVREGDYLTLTMQRRSVRSFAKTPLTLAQLSFLLWTTQGVQSVRGKGYATLRPVPSGGARHPFETYIAAQNVEGLEPAIYHYLPIEHALEWIAEVPKVNEAVVEALCGQGWVAGAGATFFYSFTPYRCEWRYSYAAHRVALIDAGHVVQNLYLSSEALGCGACAVAAFDQAASDALLHVDGEEEYTIYAAPVGVKP